MFLDDRASQNNTMTVRELLSVFGQIVPLDTIAPNASKPGMRASRSMGLVAHLCSGPQRVDHVGG